MDSFTVINPNADINEAIKWGKWFSGFAEAVAYFEHYGTSKVRNYIDSRILQPIQDEEKKTSVRKQLENDFGKRLERLGAKDIAFLLYASELIDTDTFLKMREITTWRNSLVHPSRKGISLRYTIEARKARELLEQAISCIRKIFEISIAEREASGNSLWCIVSL